MSKAKEEYERIKNHPYYPQIHYSHILKMDDYIKELEEQKEKLLKRLIINYSYNIKIHCKNCDNKGNCLDCIIICDKNLIEEISGKSIQEVLNE